MLGVGNPGRVDMRYMLKTKTYQYKTNIELSDKVIFPQTGLRGGHKRNVPTLIVNITTVISCNTFYIRLYQINLAKKKHAICRDYIEKHN